MHYNGQKWCEDSSRAVQGLSMGVAMRLRKQAANEPDKARAVEIFKAALKAESIRSMKDMMETAKASVTVQPDEFDTDPFVFNTQNGALLLKSGELARHDRLYMLSKIAGCEYRPDAPAPVWDRFLNEIMGGDEDMVGFLKRAVGYSLSGDCSGRCMFILHGSGTNGKSTFLETIARVMGDYATTTSVDLLMMRKQEGISEDLARLRGARYVTAAEVDEGRRLAESKIKAMTGRDTLSARFLYGHTFNFLPQFKLWMSTNHKPIIRGTDKAIWNRIRLVPFAVTIAPDAVDPHLNAKLSAELPGILRWAVDGFGEWVGIGLNPPRQVTDATAAYRTDMDAIGEWIEERCELVGIAKIKVNLLYADYRRYSTNTGEEPISNKAFTLALEERGIDRERSKHDRFYRGIHLRQQSPESEG